ncbi:MAG: helix-turn-helix domain-containing protein [Steroidobacteraceae bacterium]
MSWDAIRAGEFLGVNPKTARAMAARGEIPATKVGKAWRYDEATLSEWLRGRTRENFHSCPSISLRIPRTGKSDSRSLASRLDARLAHETGIPPRS